MQTFEQKTDFSALFLFIVVSLYWNVRNLTEMLIRSSDPLCAVKNALHRQQQSVVFKAEVLILSCDWCRCNAWRSCCHVTGPLVVRGARADLWLVHLYCINIGLTCDWCITFMLSCDWRKCSAWLIVCECGVDCGLMFSFRLSAFTHSSI